VEIYLIRHTLPDIKPGICYGRSDIDVGAGFSQDLIAVKAKLAEVEPAKCFTSPSQRCVKLAEALYSKTVYPTAIIQDARLMELDFGDWELSSWDDIPRTALDQWADDHAHQAPPNGETFHELHRRATEFLGELGNTSVAQAIAVVAHAGVIRALLAETLGLPLMNIFRINIDYGSVTQLLMEGHTARVGYVNR
jgi:alpha-ribazole phosphatase